MSQGGPLLVATVAAGVGFVMTRAGLGVGLLLSRVSRRHCAACGRRLGPRGCKRCGV